MPLQEEKMELPKRKRNRWEGYDYSSSGLYFITIVIEGRQCLLGNIEKETLFLSAVGKVVEETLKETVTTQEQTTIPIYTLMPNHIHFILENTGNGSLIEFIRRFKAKTSFEYHNIIGNNEEPLWQRSYYDRVIRNQREYDFISNYIFQNVIRWNKDKLNDNHTIDYDNIALCLHNIRLCKDVHL